MRSKGGEDALQSKGRRRDNTGQDRHKGRGVTAQLSWGRRGKAKVGKVNEIAGARAAGVTHCTRRGAGAGQHWGAAVRYTVFFCSAPKYRKYENHGKERPACGPIGEDILSWAVHCGPARYSGCG